MSPVSQLCKLKHRNLIDSAKVKIVGGLKKQFSILLSPFLPDHMQQQSNSTFWLSVSFLESTGKEKHFKNKKVRCACEKFSSSKLLGWL